MENTFDYIIIGAGSAGCVLANRLSSNPDIKVCLIEAGPSHKTHWIDYCNPINMLYLMNSKKYNWLYKANGNEITGNRKFFWPRGKALGGSSSINAMIYTRGHKNDYDNWSALGNKGWDYKSVLPYFMKSERQVRGDGKYHGIRGEMDVVDPNFHFPASYAFLKACEELGIPRNHDLNGIKFEGVDFFQITQTLNGHRGHSATTFLDPVIERKNLSVLTHAHIHKIQIQKKTACGVEYFDMRNRKKQITLKASREVILSAGVINSPQILLLSGIGPSHDLQKLGIPLQVNLPGVGENLQDHPDIILRCLDKSGTSLTVSPKPSLVKFLMRFYNSQRPFLYTPTDAGGFVKSDPGLKVPDLQLQFAAVRMQPHGAGLFTPSRAGFVLHVCHMQPESRGKISITSADPFSPPRIEAGYFNSSMELNALVKGVKLAREILSQPAMREFNRNEEVPGNSVKSDSEIRNFILQKMETVYHTAGSCKMGIDKMAVVSPTLKVHGVKNLRVIDSSIMPVITRSNIHAPTVMIAEKGAEFILKNKYR